MKLTNNASAISEIHKYDIKLIIMKSINQMADH